MNTITCEDAYIQHEAPGCWRIGNQCFELILAQAGEGIALEGLLDRKNQCEFLPAEDNGLFSVQVNLKTLDCRDFVLKDWQWRQDGAALQLAFQLDCNSFSLEIVYTLRVVPGAPGWQQRLALTAGAAGFCVHGLAPVDYQFACRTPQEIAYVMKGCKHQGDYSRDLADIPYEDFRMDAIDLGSVFLRSGRRATESHLPYLFIRATEGDAGLFLGVQWSGHWFMDAYNSLDSVEPRKIIRLACGPDEFRHTMRPGETFESPLCYMGVYKGTPRHAALAHRRFLEKAVLPPMPHGGLPVTCNAWFSLFTNISDEGLRKEADIAASVGVEYFIIDAGWYGGTLFPCGGAFSTGLGMWEPDPNKFPHGMKALSDYVHEKGMKFGLWVEPERVDLRTHTAGRWEQQWLAADEGDKPYQMQWEWDPHPTGWLCFGAPAVRQWAKEWISDLVEQNAVDWLKCDSNWWKVCRNPAHGHQETDGEYAQVLGIYEVLEQLRVKFPNLVIENCAGGGTRMDTGILQHSHVQWIDDESELPQRVRYHCSRLSHYMPQYCSYVLSYLSEDLSRYGDPAGSPFCDRFDAELRSRMLGLWGLGYHLGKLPEAALGAIRDNIALYKSIRSILRNGDFYTLMQQRELIRPALKVEENEAYLFVLQDSSQAVLFVFQNRPGPMEPVRLTGLREQADYTVRELTGSFSTVCSTGELMQVGIVLQPAGQSAVYRIEVLDSKTL